MLKRTANLDAVRMKYAKHDFPQQWTPILHFATFQKGNQRIEKETNNIPYEEFLMY